MDYTQTRQWDLSKLGPSQARTWCFYEQVSLYKLPGRASHQGGAHARGNPAGRRINVSFRHNPAIDFASSADGSMPQSCCLAAIQLILVVLSTIPQLSHAEQVCQESGWIRRQCRPTIPVSLQCKAERIKRASAACNRRTEHQASTHTGFAHLARVFEAAGHTQSYIPHLLK